MDKNSKEFKRLQREWYGKARKSGFEDIEYTDTNGEGHLRQHHAARFQTKEYLKNYESREEYYRLAGQFAHDYQFQDELDRKIWELHAEGFSNPEVVAKLSQPRKPVSMNRVRETLKRLKEVMKCRARET